jgi:hypothetical protein
MLKINQFSGKRILSLSAEEFVKTAKSGPHFCHAGGFAAAASC